MNLSPYFCADFGDGPSFDVTFDFGAHAPRRKHPGEKTTPAVGIPGDKYASNAQIMNERQLFCHPSIGLC